MRKTRTITVVLTLAVAVVAALVLGGSATAKSTRASATTIQVRGGEFFFKLSKKTLPKAGKVTFVFKNVGHVGHDLKIDGTKTPVINPGKTAKLTVTFKKKGKYPYRCTVPGHAAAGMKGVFTVK